MLAGQLVRQLRGVARVCQPVQIVAQARVVETRISQSWNGSSAPPNLRLLERAPRAKTAIRPRPRASICTTWSLSP